MNSSKRIDEKDLLKILDDNINFVEKYLNSASSIQDNVEKEIAFRELGVIAFSCVEAVYKLVLVKIKNRCESKKCPHTKECPYFSYKVAKGGAIDLLNHLINARLFWLSPDMYNRLDSLRDARNYIHLSKYLGKARIREFDKAFVIDVLPFYYDAINQFELCKWYFENDNLCLKELDENGYEDSEKLNIESLKQFYSFKIMMLFNKLFYQQEISLNDEFVLKKLREKDNANYEEIAKYYARALYFENVHFLDEKEHKKAVDDFCKRVECFSQSNLLVSMIKDYLMKCKNNSGIISE